MSNRNDREERIAATVATIAAGAAIGYGAYKLFEFLSGSQQSQGNQLQSRISEPRTIPLQLYSTQPIPKASIYVVDTVETCRYAMLELKSHCDEVGVLGFDCEWNSECYGRRKVALLQLASHRGLCVLVRLSELRHIPPELKEILEDPNILYVGVKPSLDKRHLYEDYDCSVERTLELGYMAQMAGLEGFKSSLGSLSEKYLGVPLEKNIHVRCSDWEADTLSETQIIYAAKDALVAIELFKFFAKKIRPNMSTNNYDQVIQSCSQYINKEI